jgi:hypothetical protein
VAEVIQSFRGPVLVTASSLCDYVKLEADGWFELRDGVLRPAEPACGHT